MKHWNICTQKERVERWENVLRVLQNLSPHERRKHWDMSTWGIKTSCGTIACAAGHCGLDSWFRRRKFQLNFSKDNCNCLSAEITPVEGFFGEDGTSRIFYNATTRPVSEVIEEVKTHIKRLEDEET